VERLALRGNKEKRISTLLQSADIGKETFHLGAPNGGDRQGVRAEFLIGDTVGRDPDSREEKKSRQKTNPRTPGEVLRSPAGVMDTSTNASILSELDKTKPIQARTSAKE